MLKFRGSSQNCFRYWKCRLTSRMLLRSSSLLDPSDPVPGMFFIFFTFQKVFTTLLNIWVKKYNGLHTRFIFILKIKYLIEWYIHKNGFKDEPAAGSPTATMLRLVLHPTASIQSLNSSYLWSSEIVTGGVYKEQGHIHSALMRHCY